MQFWSENSMVGDGPHYGARPAHGAERLLIVGTGATAPVAVERAAHALNFVIEIGDATDIPAFGGGFAAIWACVDGGDIAGLIDRLDAALTDGGVALIIDARGDAIDPVWSRFGDRDGVMLVVDPEPNEVHAALGSMAGGLAMALHSPVQTDHQQQLERLQDEVNRIARTLAKMSEPEARLLLRAADGGREPPSPFIEDQLREVRQSFSSGGALRPLGEAALPVAPPVASREVRRIIRLRRVRDQFFEPELFADPAWDMLLDLYAARLEHNRVSVSSLCIAAAVPATTALRWIKALTTSGVFERRADPHDGRRIFVALSDSAAAAMHAYFAAIVDEGAVI
jgi:DNA-binding MarR family transcriptional regulator